MKKVIKLVGEISYYGINAEYIESELNGLTENDTIEFVIHSGGGSVFEGMYIYNLLLASKAKKVGYIYGISASMMTVLGVAMDELYMCPLSMYMTHNVSSLALGNAAEMENSIDLIKKLDSILLEAYKKKTQMSEYEILSKLMNNKDNWFTPQQAFELGLIDGIKEPVKEIIEKDSELSEYNYNNLMDVAAANVGDRSKVLNKLVTLNFSKMGNTETKEKGTLGNIPATSDNSELVASLSTQVDNYKSSLVNKETEIATLTSKLESLEKEKESIVTNAKNEVAKAISLQEEATKRVEEMETKLYKQEVVNRVNLSVAKITENGKPLNTDKSEKIVTAFLQKHNVVIENEKESCVDKYTGGVIGDSINAAIQHYVIDAGFIAKQRNGINANANLTSNNFSFDNAQNAISEEKAILKRQKELNKEGFSDYSKAYVASMLAAFSNSEHPHIQALKKLKF